MYQLNTGMVKYHNEKVDSYEVPVRFSIANPKPKTIYAQVEIIDAGNLNFTFADGTTVKQYSINANTTFVVSENLLPGTNPSGTMKDSVTLKVSYYSNSNYTGLFGTDTIQITVNYYIQNSDLTWVSSDYPDDSAFIVDYWDNTCFSTSTGQPATGKLGNLTLTMNSTKKESDTQGIVSSLAPQLLLSVGWYHTSKGSKTWNVSVPLSGAEANNVFLAGIINWTSRDWSGGNTPTTRIYAEFTGAGAFYSTTTVPSVFKLVWFPSEFEKRLRFYIYIYSSYSYEVTDVYIRYILDGLIAFNPLP
ncbi:hypothetical protein TK1345 [Thermococcus kodakarensis KOD1]|uniref:Uncharacterized protein n=1 Tax=Thermococcus kodakarensis (strain ATCC BAA-918 / JCM 12380 / KOD1) TaxID=69014 RepID=Q5JGU3_THEKO|nr:hypothetical protein [Thermococcus kodakarensis]WCN27325.1 hypothetical protein POG15_06840 [Thermococcus kodakarensis]WCN29613.1 hypothetical protein POG21_06830 [Thermococcus kodakarensis]BAD85534.1 hypothetical protein TK1345 [Thermococcus kodakarensis KOD1]